MKIKWFRIAFKVGAGFYTGKVIVTIISELPVIWKRKIIAYSEKEDAPKAVKELAEQIWPKERKKSIRIKGFTG